MYEHSVYIALAYSAATVILAWCAIAPVIRARRARQQLAREYARGDMGGKS